MPRESVSGRRMEIVSTCDGGVMVSIVAFQAVDPGSIPGHRTFIYFCQFSQLLHWDFVTCRSQYSKYSYSKNSVFVFVIESKVVLNLMNVTLSAVLYAVN